MKNNYVFISGGTTEIGEELIKKFSKDYNIIFSYCNSKSKSEKIIKKYRKYNSIESIRIDLLKKKTINKFETYINKKKIKIQFFIHLANLHFQRNEITKIKTKIFSDHILANCLGSFALTQKVIKNMKRNLKLDKFVYFISSQSVDYGGNMLSPYVASKGFLNSLSLSLSKELGKYNIKVNTIVLGKFFSKSFKKNFKKNKIKDLISDIPLSRLGESKDVSNLIYSLSQNNSYLSGAKIKITGGR